MAVSQAQMRANSKYRSKTYDRIDICAPRGCKQVYQAMARSADMSLNAYVLALLDANARDLGFKLPDDPDVLIC